MSWRSLGRLKSLASFLRTHASLNWVRHLGCAALCFSHNARSNNGSRSFQAAFDPRVLSSVCFFATDVHSATLGKGKNDDSLVRVRKGDMAGKELVVRLLFHFSAHPSLRSRPQPRR